MSGGRWGRGPERGFPRSGLDQVDQGAGSILAKPLPRGRVSLLLPCSSVADGTLPLKALREDNLLLLLLSCEKGGVPKNKSPNLTCHRGRRLKDKFGINLRATR